MTFEREIELAKLLVQEAAALAIDYQRRGVTAEAKLDESPVTAADRACEKLIVDQITREFPDDGILGEEGSNRNSHSGRKWIIDPIDGTRDFVRGIPLWAVLIALEHDGQVVVGAAHCPLQGMLFWAAKNQGAWSNDTRLKVSTLTDPTQAVVSFNGFHKEGIQTFSHRLVGWLQRSWAVRSLGGAVDAMLVAEGRADIWIEPNAQPWDFAPLKILIEEAGGVFRSFDGKSGIYAGNGYACTPGLEPYVRELLYSDK
jgi:histidinol phosphatase-like enzyme (inositol monophosphatase family)